MSKINRPFFIAEINEANCVGCTKCIQACPVDAIFGAEKHMHVVITQHCIGCKLCIEPCPVDCITMVPHSTPFEKKTAQLHHQQKKQRLLREKKAKNNLFSSRIDEEKTKKAYIIEAIQRAKQKKS